MTYACGHARLLSTPVTSELEDEPPLPRVLALLRQESAPPRRSSGLSRDRIVAVPTNWRGALTDWANGRWEVYHRHRWVLQAASAGPPADPGQLSWLNAGVSALGATPLPERDKLGAVMAVLHYVRGAAALPSRQAPCRIWRTPVCSRSWSTPPRFPALSLALRAGVFDDASGDPLAEFRTGLEQLIDGVEVKVAAAAG
jgi:hypothetical protein